MASQLTQLKENSLWRIVKLYKQDSKGNIRVWYITVDDNAGTYTVTHGINDGKLQTTTVKVKPKNVGRSNETSVAEQARFEADSLWHKQLDKGYSITISSFVGCVMNLKSMITNQPKLYLPMLAKSFSEHSNKIKYPCYYQPKLDGIRCLSYIDINNCVTLRSRKQKEFLRIEHIEIAVAPLLQTTNLVLDGELYSKSLSFQEITSIVKQVKKAHKDVEKLEYHIYDCYFLDRPDMNYADRQKFLHSLLQKTSKPIVQVHTGMVTCEDGVYDAHASMVKLGYEGIMLRNTDGPYEQDRRSPNLQKLKSFIDAEFEIIGGTTGKGKFEGMCVFKCRTQDGNEFDVMPEGSAAQRRQYLDDLPLLIGKMLTVRYFEITKDGVPRFPVGVSIRDYE